MTSPFSNSLKLDEHLKFEGLKSSLNERISTFLRENSTPQQKLDSAKPFPKPYVFAKFASLVYKDSNNSDQLPKDWEILISSKSTNGYYGRAYWRPDLQQVVIAHRGTEFGFKWECLKDLKTDLNGVFNNTFDSQISSAVTFANKVKQVLAEFEATLGYKFQLFFTGHSLGGWLAQITTFSAKYLKLVGSHFQFNDKYLLEEHHAHTLTFDSPGCKDMISKLINEFCVRHSSQPISASDLDITSYLSAPNIVNTCNFHVGKLLRIFFEDYNYEVDNKDSYFRIILDSSFIKNIRDNYNYHLYTHSIENILKTFDPSTGESKRDANGKQKLKEVIDWPNAIPLVQSEETDTFYKWANKLNKFTPAADSEEFRQELENNQGYYPIRYQTKEFKENKCNLNVFTRSEKAFLQTYQTIRDHPELLNARESFSENRNAAENLQDFKIESMHLCCSSSKKLNELIPYVKRLLQVYPIVKTRVEEYAKQDSILKALYLFESGRKCDDINIIRRQLDFKDDERLNTILTADHSKIYHVSVQEDPIMRLSMFHALIERIQDRQESILFLGIRQFLEMHSLFDFKTVLEKTGINMVLIECKQNDEADKETLILLFRDIQSLLKKKAPIKIVFVAHQSFNSTFDDVKREIGYPDEIWEEMALTQFCLNHLTEDSLEKLLNKEVEFQGHSTRLNFLLKRDEILNGDAISNGLLNCETILALANGNKIKIGCKLETNRGFNEDYYVKRSLVYRNISREILENKNGHFIISGDIKSLGRLPDNFKLFENTTNAEMYFEDFKEKNPNGIIHWLCTTSNKELLALKRSHGSLKLLKKYVRKDVFEKFKEDEFLTQKASTRFLIISDKAGMGKSTILTHFAHMLRKNEAYSDVWIIRINLNDYTKWLLDIQKKKSVKEIKINVAIDFLQNEILKLKTSFEQDFFKNSYESGKAVLMLDGFDEVSPHYENEVKELIGLMASSPLRQLWLTTRPHKQNDLEDQLQQLACTLEPFSVEDQLQFLKDYWNLTIKHRNQNKQERICLFSESLIKHLSSSLSKGDQDITGIPLQTRMVAEIFEEECKSSIDSEQISFQENLDLNYLYEKFIKKKYTIYLREKNQFDESKPISIEQEIFSYKKFLMQLQNMALLSIFDGDERKILLEAKSQQEFKADNTELLNMLQNEMDKYKDAIYKDYNKKIETQISKVEKGEDNTGLIDRIVDNKPEFVHRTFAEYLVSEYFSNQIEERLSQFLSSLMPRLERFLLENILQKDEHKIIRRCLNKRISNFAPKKSLDSYNLTGVMKTDITMSILIASIEGNGNLIKMLLKNISEEEKSEIINNIQNESALISATTNSTALLNASENGHFGIVKYLLEHGAKIDVADKDGKTALLYASENGHFEIVKYLLEQGAKVDVADKDGKTALLYASRYGHFEIVKYLLEQGAKVDVADEDGKTALLYVLRFGHFEIVKYLLEQGAKVDVADKDGKTALLYASRYGHFEIVKYLLEQGAKVDVADKDGKTALLYVLRFGHFEIVKYLLEQGAKIDVADKDGKTALFYASENGHIEIVKYLLEHGAKIDVADKDGKTALLYASDYGHIEIVKYLLEQGAKIDVADKNGKTALFYAFRLGHFKIVKYLLEQGAKIDAADKDGQTALLYASENGHIEIVKYLLEQGAKIDAADKDGQTALLYASRHGHFEIVKYLLEQGAKIDAADKDGQTALLYASRHGHFEIVKYLLEQGAKIDAADKDGQTALLYASRYEHFEIVNYLLEQGANIHIAD